MIFLLSLIKIKSGVMNQNYSNSKFLYFSMYLLLLERFMFLHGSRLLSSVLSTWRTTLSILKKRRGNEFPQLLFIQECLYYALIFESVLSDIEFSVNVFCCLFLASLSMSSHCLMSCKASAKMVVVGGRGPFTSEALYRFVEGIGLIIISKVSSLHPPA